MNEMQLVLGFTWMDSGKLFVLPFLLLIGTVVGLHRAQRGEKRSRWSGFVAVAALVWLAVGTAIEFWGFQPGSYELTFEAETRPVLRDGWWIQTLGSLLLALAFAAFGANAVRAKQLPRGMVPMLVVGAAATVFLTPAFILPGLVWILLGATLLRPRWSGAAP